MTIDDIIDIQTECEGDKCAVCGKSVANGQAHAQINHAGQVVLLCCRLCLGAFEKTPDDYVRRQETGAEARAIFELLRPTRPSVQ